jgi:hypothetical protein
MWIIIYTKWIGFGVKLCFIFLWYLYFYVNFRKNCRSKDFQVRINKRPIIRHIFLLYKHDNIYFYKGLNKMGCVCIYFTALLYFFGFWDVFFCVFIFIEIQVTCLSLCVPHCVVHRFVQSIFPMTWNWDQHEFNVYKINFLIVSPHKL